MTDDEPCDNRKEIPAITTSCNSQTGEITVFLSFSDGRVVDTCVLSPDNPSQGNAAWRRHMGLDDTSDGPDGDS